MAFERIVYEMDMGWRFRLESEMTEGKYSKSHDAVYNSVKSGSAQGPASKRAYDDSRWQQVNLPHDYLAEADIVPEGVASHGYRKSENAWYRKTFVLDGALEGSHAMLVFEGISTSAVIWLNGSVMERSFSNYSEIAIDVTERLYYDRINTLAVYVRGADNEGWWYEGAGIYRHVRLYIKNDVHIAHNGIWARPVLVDAQANRWQVELETAVENSAYEDKTAQVRAYLMDSDRVIGETGSVNMVCGADGETKIKTEIPVKDPKRWDIDAPNLYTVKVEVLREGECVDADSTRIGFRTIRMDAEKGFFLNEKPIKIKGTCNHQDHAGVGVAVPDSIQYYRIRRLKDMGCNAYRCSHNPPAKEILDACDEYGLIVMDENRKFEARADVLRNLETLVKRDRNHPSVVFWSLFNEEPLQNSSEGRAIFRKLKSCVKKLDDTRLIMGAVNDIIHPNGSGMEMDVLGINYGIDNIERVHREYPHMPIMGSENNSAVTTRGCYASDRDNAHVLNNYDEEIVPWGQSIRYTWDFVRKHDYFAGIFIWTGFDYRGEPTPFVWPSCSSQFGIMDTCGFPKDSFYFNRAMFVDEPMMHILPHWNWKEGENVRVMTVTNCEEAELFVNGRSLGRKASDLCAQCEWNAAFETGEISAVGYRDGKAVAWAKHTTAGKPAKIMLSADRTKLHNAGQDTAAVRVAVTDAQGVECPLADNLIHFEVLGDGILAGVGNGDPNSHEPDQADYRKLYCGLCQALVMADVGARKVRLIARAEGLESAELEFAIEHRPARNYLLSRPNMAVTGILASVQDSDEKPDPARVWSRDDMNSFAPMILEKNTYDTFSPHGFRSGWREFRIPVSVPENRPEGKIPALEIAAIVCEEAEFYVGGQRMYAGRPEYKRSLRVPLDVAETDFEVRALLKARKGEMVNGFGVSITLSFVEK